MPGVARCTLGVTRGVDELRLVPPGCVRLVLPGSELEYAWCYRGVKGEYAWCYQGVKWEYAWCYQGVKWEYAWCYQGVKWEYAWCYHSNSPDAFDALARPDRVPSRAPPCLMPVQLAVAAHPGAAPGGFAQLLQLTLVNYIITSINH